MSEDGIVRRYSFAMEYGALLEDSLGVLNAIWFSDEAHLHLDAYIKTRTTTRVKVFYKRFLIRCLRRRLVT
jgi:hypothetical protein